MAALIPKLSRDPGSIQLSLLLSQSYGSKNLVQEGVLTTRQTYIASSREGECTCTLQVQERGKKTTMELRVQMPLVC